MDMKKVRKAVFPVAGMGTRFLPATKANPKEMLPVVDKPLIQYAAEEAVKAGITELVFVTSSSKRAIEDHFDKNFEMESLLKERKKKDLLAILNSIVPEGVSCCYVRQPEALGLGHAVLCAKPVVGDEPFAVILADDLIANDGRCCLGQMVDVYDTYRCSVLGVQQVAREETDRYGIVKAVPMAERISNVDLIVEKPAPTEAPSTLGVVGRYILTPRIFDMLEATQRGAGGEIQLTDAIASLLHFEKVLAYEFVGRRFDCGDKLGYLEATVEYALKHPSLAAGFRNYLRTLLPTLDKK